jgi:bifunctional enzyme CysN/CysC
MIGVRNVVVVVNKMDSMNYSQAEYDKVCAAVDEIIKQEKLVRTAAIPVSAYNSVNLFKPAEKEMSWYSGKSLISALCDIEQQLTARDEQPETFRMVLQDVYRFGKERYYAGRVTSGQIHAGSEILFSPSAKRAIIKEIKKSDTQSVADATKGNSIVLTLHDEIFVERGEVISLPNEMPEIETELHSRIIWLGKDAYEPNQEYLIKIGTAESKCSIESTTELSNGIFVDVIIRTQHPLAFDNVDSGVSNFVICSKWETTATGVVLEQSPLAAVPVLKSKHVSKETDYVEQYEFEKQHGHKGAVVWLTGLSGAGKSTLAKHLERQLFNRGYRVVVLDADNLRHGLCADLGFNAMERSENVRRIAQVAKLLVNTGNIVIVACISPYKKDREAARQIIGDDSFLEVFVFCPLEVCRQRDPKGLYAKSSRGELNELSGIGAPYQPPALPALRINTEVTDPRAAENTVINLLEEAQIIGEANVVAKATSWVR